MAAVGRLQPFRDRTLTLLDRNNLAPVPSFIPFGAPIFTGLGSENQVLLPAVGPLWDLLSTGPHRRSRIQGLVQNQVLLSCCGTLWELLSTRPPWPSATRNTVRVPLRSTSRFACLVGDPHRHSHNDRPSNDWHGQGVLRDLRRKRPPLAIDTRTSGEGHGCELTALSLRVGRTGNRCCSWC
jgi:hypothetical protein